MTTGEGTAGRAAADSEQQENRRLRERMERIGRKLIVLSGKGGVGKSTVAANLAAALAVNHKVGLLDVDIHGPSIPRLAGIAGAMAGTDETSLIPVAAGENLSVMSMGLLLRDAADAVIWRGPVKYGVIRQFLADVAWGDLDYLVVDCPPGTGDEPLSVAQMVGHSATGVVVTTPQEIAIADVRRCITFCRQAGLPVAGIVENMSGFECSHCQTVYNLFGKGGGENLAREMNVPFLGAIPFDPAVVAGGDAGKPFVADAGAGAVRQAFLDIAGRIENTPATRQHECQRRHEGGDDHQCCGQHRHDDGHRCGGSGKQGECGHGEDPSHHCTCQ